MTSAGQTKAHPVCESVCVCEGLELGLGESFGWNRFNMADHVPCPKIVSEQEKYHHTREHCNTNSQNTLLYVSLELVSRR